MGSVTLTGVDAPLRIASMHVTPNLVRLWGLTPVLGRSFNPEDGRAGATPVTLLTFGFWQRQFSSDANALGQRVLLDGVAHTIVGVLPPEGATGILRDADVFLPLVLDPLRGDRRERALFVTGRLKPGVTRAQADSDLQAIARQLRDEHPDSNDAVGASVLPLIEMSGFNVRILLSILGLIALLVLVVACANVSGILVAQSIGRRHELAIRAALGGGRLDRVRQLMTESVLASAVACVIGLLLAAWGISALRWLGGDSFGLAEIQMNRRALLVGLVTALVAPFGFGLLPALRAAAPDVQELKDGARGTGIALRGRRTRSLLVALQVGAAMILMAQIGMLVRTTWALSDTAPGFDPAQVLTFRIGLSESRYKEADAIDRFTMALMSRLSAVPGIASAGIIDRLPVADREPLARLAVEGTTPVRPRSTADDRTCRHRGRLSRHHADSCAARTRILRRRVVRCRAGGTRQRRSGSPILAGSRSRLVHVSPSMPHPGRKCGSTSSASLATCVIRISIRERCRRSSCPLTQHPAGTWQSS